MAGSFGGALVTGSGPTAWTPRAACPAPIELARVEWVRNGRLSCTGGGSFLGQRFLHCVEHSLGVTFRGQLYGRGVRGLFELRDKRNIKCLERSSHAFRCEVL